MCFTFFDASLMAFDAAPNSLAAVVVVVVGAAVFVVVKNEDDVFAVVAEVDEVETDDNNEVLSVGRVGGVAKSSFSLIVDIVSVVGSFPSWRCGILSASNNSSLTAVDPAAVVILVAASSLVDVVGSNFGLDCLEDSADAAFELVVMGFMIACSSSYEKND